MKKSFWYILATIFIIISGVALWYILRPEPKIHASISVAEAMSSGDQEGYFRATGPRDFVFPDDHGPHPGYKTEWWYYTGNLSTKEGRDFAYQFTIFRNQLNPPADEMDSLVTRSAWSTDQFYLAHFAVADVEQERHFYEERSSRGAMGLAGARSVPYRIWLEDWEVLEIDSETNSGKEFSVRIQAEMEDGPAIDLRVTPAKPLVLQGEQGYDRKGPEEGNASYYLSFTRMDTKGMIKVDEKQYEVSGFSWMDHEWSTSALGDDQEGWDWFSIQLSNGYDLMYYQLRLADGSISDFKALSLIDPQGNKIAAQLKNVKLEVMDRWKSPTSKSVYPSRWKIDIPQADLSLDVKTVFSDQEMNVSVLYYEGALSVSGIMDGKDITGQGFIEMTGYGE